MVKNLPAMREAWVQSMGWEDALREGIATHSSILAWGIPWTEESGDSPWSCKESDMTEQLSPHVHLHQDHLVLVQMHLCSLFPILLPLLTLCHVTSTSFSFFSSTPLFQLLPKEHHSSLTSQSLIIILHYASPKHPMILVKFWKSTDLSRSGSLSVMSNSLPTHGLQPARLFYP